jgi:alkylated DNA repair dioxygenase AlkB
LFICGTHSSGKHSDNEKQLRTNSPIISISLGATRIFRIRRKGFPEDGKIVKDLSVVNNTIVIMGGTMQKTHTHEITKIGVFYIAGHHMHMSRFTGGQKGLRVGRRINITLRQFE